jgi:hypothetical protein
MSWGKNSLDVFLPFFCENQQLPPFFPSSSFLLPPLSAAGLCCWADERAEAFEFGYLIVLAFGSCVCVQCARRVSDFARERDKSLCTTTPAFDPANITGETDAGQQQQQQLFTISNADEVGG